MFGDHRDGGAAGTKRFCNPSARAKFLGNFAVVESFA